MKGVLCLSELPRETVRCHSNQYCYYNFSNGVSSVDSCSYPVKYCIPSSIYWCIVANYTLNPFPQGYLSIYDLAFWELDSNDTADEGIGHNKLCIKVTKNTSDESVVFCELFLF